MKIRLNNVPNFGTVLEKGEFPENFKQENVTIILAFEHATAVGIYLGDEFCNLRDLKPFEAKVIAWCELPKYPGQ